MNFNVLSNHLTLIGIYCILALSLNLINGSLGAFSLGHHGFWGMGAYVGAAIVWSLGSPEGSLWVLILSCFAAMAAAALFGLLVGAPSLRLRGDYLAIATLGFAEIFIIGVRNSESWTGLGDIERGFGGAAGFSLGDTYRGHSYAFNGGSGNDVIFALMGSNEGKNACYLILTWCAVLLTFLFIRNFLRSGYGRAVLAIREDETAAELMGVNLVKHKVMVFVIGAALAGLAGALSANYRSSVSPNQFVMMEGIKILLMVVLGGLGSMSGTLIAVFVLYSVEQFLGTIETKIPFVAYTDGAFQITYMTIKDLWQVVFAFLLIALMLLRPNGIMGRDEFSRAFFRKSWARWRSNPRPVLLTLVQWVQFILSVLFSSRVPWLLYVSLAMVVALQLAKRGLSTPKREAPV